MKPAFAKDFPADPELDALVEAFGRGDFRSASAGAERLAKSDDAAIAQAARTLLERTRPDPRAKLFFLFAAALLTLLTIYWIVESRRPHDAPQPRRIEYVK